MDPDDIRPKAGDPLAALALQDLSPFSVAELEARAAALQAEVARIHREIERAVNHRASADALFKR